MRAAIVPFCATSFALLALLLPIPPAAAEAGAAAQTPPAKAGRVGSLSPDEQRRAARGRERANAAEKAARERTAAKSADGKTAEGKAAAAKAPRDQVSRDRRPGTEAAGVAATGPVPPGPVAPGTVANTPAVAKDVAAPARDGAAAAGTHRSLAVVEPAPDHAGPAAAARASVAPARAAPPPRYFARMHRVRHPHYATGAPQIGDRVPDDAALRPLPPGLFGVARRAPPYERYAEDVRPVAPWGYRPAYPPPPYPFYRPGW